MCKKPFCHTQIDEVSQAQYEELVSAHKEYIRKKYNEGLSKSEVLELRLLKWKLARVEESLYGELLDHLRLLGDRSENLAQEIQSVEAEVCTKSNKKKA